MKLIAHSLEISPVSLVGGKGHHLQKLVSWKAPVAPFLVLTTEVFRSFQEKKIIPESVENEVKFFLESHPKIVLRSSMVGEDHADASFAGLFETFLNLDLGTWKDALFKIYDSMNSKRVTEYLQLKKLSVDLSMAVVVQAQVEVEKSGVLFTRSPINPTSAIVIDAGLGLGEGVVSGLVSVDQYQLTRTGEVISQKINHPYPVLSKNELNELLRTALNLEKFQGSPSDLEWGYEKDKLYIFQIRPITQEFKPLEVFVDTNLSESYPGIVSPLTARFVQLAYKNVFRESAKILGAGEKRLSQLTFHYERLISSVDHHLYYNLEHYYAVLRALPGGEKNISNWHKIIGGKLDNIEIPYHETRLTKFETLSSGLYFFKLILFRKSIFSHFLVHLDQEKKLIEEKSNQLKNSNEIIIYLNELIKKPLGFGLTVVNDIFIMMGLGFLSNALRKRQIPEEELIDLLKTEEGVDSLRPLEIFNFLVTDLSHDFLKVIESMDLKQGFAPYENVFHDLKKRGYVDEVRKIEEFLKQYGDRSFEELKLESLPLKNNPKLLFELIKWSKNNELSEKNILNQKVIHDFSFLERRVIAFTRECIAVREATRLWRGKFYHLIRNLILQSGEKLQEEDPHFRNYGVYDFFSLTHEEWLEFAEKKLTSEEVISLINGRKKWQTSKKNYPEMIQWVQEEELPILGQQSFDAQLTGQGVSPGEVEGIALVLDNPSEALKSDLKNFILVTKNTDPAWVYIMSRSLGLISEKGSLLSHTAIIGRELGIPTIVGVKAATQLIKTGERIGLNSQTGEIKKL